MTNKYFAGIDPGIKNFGAAMLQVNPQLKITVVSTWCTDVGNLSSLEEFTEWFMTHNLKDSSCGHFFDLIIERFVSYGDQVRSSASEDLNELIGMLRLKYFQMTNKSASGIRAIDWKMELVKYLNKLYNFQNPGKNGSLDKTFSKAAASEILVQLGNEEVKQNIRKLTSHEADAICLAAIPLFRSGLLKKPTE